MLQIDNDTRNDSSPTSSPSPTDSPMPFLSITEKALTPLSLNSSDLDFLDVVDRAHDAIPPRGRRTNTAVDSDNKRDRWLGDEHSMVSPSCEDEITPRATTATGNVTASVGDTLTRSPTKHRFSHISTAAVERMQSHLDQLSAVNSVSLSSQDTNMPIASKNDGTAKMFMVDANVDTGSTIRACGASRTPLDIAHVFQRQEGQLKGGLIRTPRSRDNFISPKAKIPTSSDTNGEEKKGPSGRIAGTLAPQLATTSIDKPNPHTAKGSPSSPISPVSPRTRIFFQQQRQKQQQPQQQQPQQQQPQQQQPQQQQQQPQHQQPQHQQQQEQQQHQKQQKHLHHFPDLNHDQLIVENDLGLVPAPLEPQPLIRTASNSTVSLCHPIPDLNTRSGAYLGNIAALEATAERLSMTSSIDDAIRDLHRDLKLSDSRRSSLLQANLATTSISLSSGSIAPSRPPLSRQLSATSSIVNTNSAARQGGYSPAGYVLSPSHSLAGARLRSSSRDSPLSKHEEEHLASSYSTGLLTRVGPGKGSQRSVQSSKPSLSEIAELEPPMTLTKEAMDNADRSMAAMPDADNIFAPFDFADSTTPTMDSINRFSASKDFIPPSSTSLPPNGLDMAHEGSRPPVPSLQDAQQATLIKESDDRPTTSASITTFEQAQRAFGDFDGAHCPTESQPNSPPLEPVGAHVTQERRISQVPSIPTYTAGRPTSYFDPESGNQMLYYPARVPAMLKLPPKLGKGTKTATVRAQKRNQILSQMNIAEETPKKENATWLPDPFGEQVHVPFLPENVDLPTHGRSASEADTIKNDQNSLGVSSDATANNVSITRGSLDNRDGRSLGLDGHLSVPAAVLQQEQVHSDSNRKSRLTTNVDKLPPQLRASAYFELPSHLPDIKIKDESPMATLDSILDASADAPVSAFTDHVFAGKLGNEVYGREKTKKSTGHMKKLSTNSLGQRNRKNFLGLGKHKDSDAGELDCRDTIASGTLPDDPDSQHLAEDDDRDSFSDQEEYSGPPTTLLAELQIRKQQNQYRTRNVNGINGLHATLLEIDAVREQESKARKTKKVNLAWEEQESNHDSDEDEVPLGVLYAAKTMQTKDINAAVAEVNRPLGLMEKRELEDNEPLARRRDRLQGRNLTARSSQMTLTPQIIQLPHLDGDGEDEDEPLAVRRRRLKGQEENLPRARPVSAAFSSELLDQFGEKDELDKRQESTTPVEETLGQRRRRLQTELQSQASIAGLSPNPEVKHMSSLVDVLGKYGGSGFGGARQQQQRVSGFMDGRFNDGLGGGVVSGSNPRLAATDPRAEEQIRLDQEAAKAHEQAERMKAMRAAMPQALTAPGVGGTGNTQGNSRLSAYMGGVLNDGTGGTGTANRRAAVDPRVEERARTHEQERLTREKEARMSGLRAQMPTDLPGLNRRASGYMNGMFNDGTGGILSQQYQQQQQRRQRGMPSYMNMPNMNINMGMNMGIEGMQMSQIPPSAAATASTGAQMDRVEMWRHGIT